ncbi:MAG: GntR family transcriptional regulator, partial [Caulobacteraceae bacterium]
MTRRAISADADAARWSHHISPSGPRYRAIVDGLAEAIRQGDLHPGERLPPQRALAAGLGVDLTTVTRAFSEAQARGLIEGAVGRGTFVRATAAELDAARVDLSMNLPPPPDGKSLGQEMAQAAQAILGRA